MRCLLLLVLALSAPPAQAQFGRRLLDRARDTVRETVRDNTPTSAQAEAAATGAATTAAETAAAAVPSGPLTPGPSGYLPGANWFDVLRQQIQVRPNGIDFPTYVGVVFFDPVRTYTVAFETADGRVIREASTLVNIVTPDGIHGSLSPRPAPNDLPPAEPGDYAFVLRADGHPIGRVPFTVEREDSGDPFNPTPSFRVEGPWRTTAALRVDPAGEDVPRFYFWTRLDEMADGGRYRVVLYRNGSQVAAQRREAHAVAQEWLAGQCGFYRADGRTRFGMADFTDGTYRAVVESGGRAVKAFPFQVAGGRVVPTPRSEPDHTPRETWRAPTSGPGAPLVWLDAE